MLQYAKALQNYPLLKKQGAYRITFLYDRGSKNVMCFKMKFSLPLWPLALVISFNVKTSVLYKVKRNKLWTE